MPLACASSGLLDSADHRDSLTEIHLGMSRRMRQRRERLAPARPANPHVVLHHRVAIGKTMLVDGFVTALHTSIGTREWAQCGSIMKAVGIRRPVRGWA